MPGPSKRDQCQSRNTAPSPKAPKKHTKDDSENPDAQRVVLARAGACTLEPMRRGKRCTVPTSQKGKSNSPGIFETH